MVVVSFLPVHYVKKSTTLNTHKLLDVYDAFQRIRRFGLGTETCVPKVEALEGGPGSSRCSCWRTRGIDRAIRAGRVDIAVPCVFVSFDAQTRWTCQSVSDRRFAAYLLKIVQRRSPRVARNVESSVTEGLKRLAKACLGK